MIVAMVTSRKGPFHLVVLLFEFNLSIYYCAIYYFICPNNCVNTDLVNMDFQHGCHGYTLPCMWIDLKEVANGVRLSLVG